MQKRSHLIITILTVFFLTVSSFCPYGFAQTTPGQKVSEEQRTREIEERQKKLLKEIEREKPMPEIEEKLPPAQPLPQGEEKAFIKKITVVGATYISEKEIKDIITPFENKELFLRDMQKVADLITDAYRKKGYITSRAYLAPQKIENGLLEIRIIEGHMGDVDVKGNKFFKSPLFKKKFSMRKGDPFNYNILRRDLVNINERPDRDARAVLMPGKEAGATDVILEVKDRLPFHAGFDYDNYGTRYVENNRYQWNIVHNNFAGLDDILTAIFGMSESDAYKLWALRYLLPITRTVELGIFAAHSNIDLAREFKDMGIKGENTTYSVYATKPIVEEDTMTISVNAGFDFKDTFNFQSGNEISRDRMRVAKAGIQMDMSDRVSRTILSNEIDIGIPYFIAGSGRKDPRSSRAGSGGEFIKYVINLIRSQKMPFSTMLLWRNQAQITPNILTSTEQFQIGGIYSVRGYPPAEFVGDKGYSTSIELFVPPYFIRKDIKVLMSRATLYDAVRIVGFYDLGIVWLKRPQFANEFKNKILTSAGGGIRFDLPENFSLRLDLAWALDDSPSEGDRLHTWLAVSKSF